MNNCYLKTQKITDGKIFTLDLCSYKYNMFVLAQGIIVQSLSRELRDNLYTLCIMKLVTL